MRPIEKTLYILNDQYLHFDLENIEIINKDNKKQCIPIRSVEEVIIYGNSTITSKLVQECNLHNISISYISEYGHFMGRFVGETNGNIFLRKKQYDLYDTPESSLIVKHFLLGKISNCRNLILRCQRDSTDINKKENLQRAAEQLLNTIYQLKETNDIDSMRGVEGAAASIYFGVFDNMLKIDDPLMAFEVRSKHPPLNNCNSLLSLLYTLLTINCTSGLESVGLDSYLGYLHRLRPGRHSLSCDIIEEMRAPIVDRFVIRLINLKQITSNDFEKTPEGIKLKPNSLKKVIQLWEKHKNEEVPYKLYKSKILLKEVPFYQAQILSHVIRGDIAYDEYLPFIWK